MTDDLIKDHNTAEMALSEPKHWEKVLGTDIKREAPLKPEKSPLLNPMMVVSWSQTFSL